jgi:hypothetical protein
LWDRASIVGDRVVEPAAHDYRDAYSVCLGIQQIGAMMGGKHPVFVERPCPRVQSYILLDQAEMGACVARAGCQIGLALKTVGNRLVFSHTQTVLEGGSAQRRIQLERSNSSGGASLIGLKQQLFGRGLKDDWSLDAGIRRRLWRCRSRYKPEGERQSDGATSPKDAHS